MKRESLSGIMAMRAEAPLRAGFFDFPEVVLFATANHEPPM